MKTNYVCGSWIKGTRWVKVACDFLPWDIYKRSKLAKEIVIGRWWGNKPGRDNVWRIYECRVLFGTGTGIRPAHSVPFSRRLRFPWRGGTLGYFLVTVMINWEDFDLSLDSRPIKVKTAEPEMGAWIGPLQSKRNITGTIRGCCQESKPSRNPAFTFWEGNLKSLSTGGSSTEIKKDLTTKESSSKSTNVLSNIARGRDYTMMR